MALNSKLKKTTVRAPSTKIGYNNYTSRGGGSDANLNSTSGRSRGSDRARQMDERMKQPAGVQIREMIKLYDVMTRNASELGRDIKNLESAMAASAHRQIKQDYDDAVSRLQKEKNQLVSSTATKNANAVLSSAKDVLEYVQGVFQTIQKNLKTAQQTASRTKSQPGFEDSGTGGGRRGTKATSGKGSKSSAKQSGRGTVSGRYNR